MRRRWLPHCGNQVRQWIVPSLSVVLALLLLSHKPTNAASLIVTNNGNEGGEPINECNAPGDNCTLRQAIALANSNPGPDDITILLSGSEEERTILMPEGGADEDRNTEGDLDITSSLSITNGSDERVFIDANNNSRVIEIIGTPETNVTIDGGDAGLMLMNGFADEGAIILSANATLVVNNVTAVGGRAERAGGAFFNDRGTMTVNNTMIAQNEAELFGAGVFNRDATSAFNNVTFFENRAFDAGGGLYVDRGLVVLSSSSFKTNRSGQGNGGGIQVATGEVFIQNSLFGSSIGGGNCARINGEYTDLGFNISDDNTCGFSDTLGEGIGDAVNPQVSDDGIKNLGGPILTVSILTTSPAIDKGNPDGCLGITAELDEFNIITDQRGFQRFGADIGGRCDIGSFEVQVPILRVERVELVEGDGLFTTFEISVFRSGRADNDVEVNYEFSLVGGSENPAELEDFYLEEFPEGGTLSWDPEEGAARTFTVNIAADKDVEPNESFVVILSDPVGALLAPDGAIGEIVIQDDDAPGFVFDPLAVNVVADGSPAEFTVRLSSRPQAPVSILFRTSNEDLCTIPEPTLEIAPENWSDRNRVTVNPGSVRDVSGVEVCKVTIASVRSEDGLYSNVAITDSINVNVFGDYELALVVSSTEIELPASEDQFLTYGVSLSSRPSGDVTVDMNVSNELCEVLPATLTFTRDNFREAQSVDLVPLGEQGDRCIIRHTISGGGYDDVDVPTISVSLIEPYVIERDLNPTPTPTITPTPTSTPTPLPPPTATPTETPAAIGRVVDAVASIPVWLPVLIVILIFSGVGAGYFVWYKRRYFDPNPPAEIIEEPEPSPSGGSGVYDSGLVGFAGSGVYEKPDRSSEMYEQTESPVQAKKTGSDLTPPPEPQPSASITPPSPSVGVESEQPTADDLPDGLIGKSTQASNMGGLGNLMSRPTELPSESSTDSGLIGAEIDLDDTEDEADAVLDSGLFTAPEGGFSRDEPTASPPALSKPAADVPDDIPDFDPDAYRQDVEQQTTGAPPAGMPPDVPDFDPDAYRQDVEQQTTGAPPAGMPPDVPDFDPDAYRQDVESQTTGTPPSPSRSSGEADDAAFGSYPANSAQADDKQDEDEEDDFYGF